MSPAVLALALVALGAAIAIVGVAVLPFAWAIPLAIILGGSAMMGAGLIALRGARR